MPIVGFNFLNINAEKKKAIEGQIQIKSKINITSVKEEKLPTGKTKSDGLRFDFEFNLNYEPKIGNINLKGFVYYMDDPKILKNILNEWKKKKILSKEVTEQIINTILYRASIKAISLAEDINLPPHIRMPIVAANVNPKDYIG